MTTVTTRSQKNKTINEFLQNVELPNKSLNSSYITVVSDTNLIKNSADFDLINDLRNKLASAEFRIAELTDEMTDVSNRLKYTNSKLKSKQLIIDDLTNTIKQLTEKMSNPKTYLNSSTQTIADCRNQSIQTETCNFVDINLVNTDTYSKGSRTLEKTEKSIVCSNDCDTQIESQDQVQIQIPNLSQNNTEKRDCRRKVMVLGDSHCRNYSKILRENSNEELDILGITKPNIKLNKIVEDVSKAASYLGKNDFVVVMGGSNNMNECYNSESIADLTKTFRNLFESTKNTNLIVSTIPFRCNNQEINRIIEHINYKMYNIVKNYEHVYLLCINNIITCEDYSIDGVHLRHRAKRVVCEQVLDIIKEWCVNDDENFWKHLHQDRQL